MRARSGQTKKVMPGTMRWPNATGCDIVVKTFADVQVESGLVNCINLNTVNPYWTDPATLCTDSSVSPSVYYRLLAFDTDNCVISGIAAHGCSPSVIAMPVNSGPKRAALFFKPPSYFTGQTEILMAALYGTMTPLIEFINIPDPDIIGGIIDAVVKFNGVVLDSTHGNTTAIYEYKSGIELVFFLITIGINSVTARKMQFGSCGTKIRERLGLGELPYGLTQRQAKIFMFADCVGLCPPVTTTFPGSSVGPIAYGWHVLDKGNEAKIVHFRDVNQYFESFEGNLFITCAPNPDSVVVSHSQSAMTQWTPRRAYEHIWIPSGKLGMECVNSRLDITITAPGTDLGGPIYVVAQGDSFQYFDYHNTYIMSLRYLGGRWRKVGYRITEIPWEFGTNAGSTGSNSWCSESVNGDYSAIITEKGKEFGLIRGELVTEYDGNAVLAETDWQAPGPETTVVGWTDTQSATYHQSHCTGYWDWNQANFTCEEQTIRESWYRYGNSYESAELRMAIVIPKNDCDAAYYMYSKTREIERNRTVRSGGTEWIHRLAIWTNAYSAPVECGEWGEYMHLKVRTSGLYAIASIDAVTEVEEAFTEVIIIEHADLVHRRGRDSKSESDGNSAWEWSRYLSFSQASPYESSLFCLSGGGYQMCHTGTDANYDLHPNPFGTSITVAQRFLGWV